MDKDVTSVTKSLDRIADALEGKSGGGSSGGGSVFLIQMTQTEDYDRVLNKTWKEIYDAYMSGATCIVQKAKTEYDPEDKPNGANMLVTNVYWDQDYCVNCADWELGKFYVYDENGYPKNYSE